MAAFLSPSDIVAELKENLLRDMDNGNRDEHLFRLIRVFKRNNIPYCRGIASVLFDILEDHQGGFSQEHLVSLRKDIIEGLYTFKLRQQDSRKPEANKSEDITRKMKVKQAQEHGDFPSTGEQSELIRKKVLLLEYKQLQGLRDLISRNLVPTGLKLGQGSSGKVTIEKVEFAVKKPHDGTNLKHEKEILFSLNHSNILTFVSYTRGPPEKLITELMMGNLREFINYKANNLRIDTIIHFASDLAHGLDYLHGNGYLHDDFKASNMLISLRPDIAKIGDFSLAKKMSPSNPETRDYLHYDHQRYKVAAVFPETFKIDVWSYGCVLMEMVLGHPPDLCKLPDEVRQSCEKFSVLENLIRGCTLIPLDECFEISEVVNIVEEFFQMTTEE